MAIFVSGFILGIRREKLCSVCCENWSKQIKIKIQKKLEAHLHNSMPNSKETVFSFSFSTSIVKN